MGLGNRSGRNWRKPGAIDYWRGTSQRYLPDIEWICHFQCAILRDTSLNGNLSYGCHHQPGFWHEREYRVRAGQIWISDNGCGPSFFTSSRIHHVSCPFFHFEFYCAYFWGCFLLQVTAWIHCRWCHWCFNPYYCLSGVYSMEENKRKICKKKEQGWYVSKYNAIQFLQPTLTTSSIIIQYQPLFQYILHQIPHLWPTRHQ